MDYFSHLAGHEGKNSLLSYLKEEGLALELSSCCDHLLDCYSNFEIEITLSEKGLEKYEDVIQAVFKYLQIVRDSGPSDAVFTEMKNVGHMKFLYADKGDSVRTVEGMGRRMPHFTDSNIEDIIRFKYEYDKFDKEATIKYAKLLCEPENVNIFLSSKSFEGKTDKEDQWFLTKYSKENISDDLISKMKSPKVNEKSTKSLGLPPTNTLIPKNFDVERGLTSSPAELRPGLWYKRDEKYGLPKAVIKMRLFTTDCLFSVKPEARVFYELFCKVM